eukprot:TRINITY_DN426_c0_g3_i1.p1 TRINITY_DN426_c0_g3~~TRINITY_DN426_c0_g3_i1.p1  ORF type:complete len:643 (-),score=185.83 TRINITY_DN426_c0_g3_i1:29-1864(-)
MAEQEGGGRPRSRGGTGGGPPKLPRPNISAKPNHLKEKLEKQREELQHELEEETKEAENTKQKLEEEFKKWEEARKQREEARKKKKEEEGGEENSAPVERRRRAKTISTATPVSAESLSFGLERPKLSSRGGGAGSDSPGPSGPPRPIPKPKKAASNVDDRVVKDLPWPERRRLTIEEVFDVHGRPRAELIREHFLKEGRLEKAAALSLITKAASLFSKEPNMLEVEAPLLIVGDIHGQFYDLIHILTEMGDPKSTQYLFLGDYVDRGSFGCEVTLLLYAYKVCYPYSFFMLRGNHESRLLTAHFNFRKECIIKYGEDVYDALMSSFDTLPIAALTTNVQGSFFCTHGGLSPSITTLDEIEDIDRFMEPPDAGPLCDLLWSDPIEEDTAIGLTDDEFQDWYELDYIPNPTRGCGFVFGYAAIATFLNNNNLLTLIRAHEVQKEGYFCHNYLKDDLDFPLTITVFSAPNYCDAYGNAAACIKITPTSFSFEQVGWVDHPFTLPNFMNGITYSLPFALEAFTKLAALLLENFIDDDEQDELNDAIRDKIKNYGKMCVIAQKFREEKDAILKGQLNMNEVVAKFERALRSDKGERRRPGTAKPGEVVKRRTKTY